MEMILNEQIKKLTELKNAYNALTENERLEKGIGFVISRKIHELTYEIKYNEKDNYNKKLIRNRGLKAIKLIFQFYIYQPLFIYYAITKRHHKKQMLLTKFNDIILIVGCDIFMQSIIDIEAKLNIW